jgi:hypothetical protein
MTKFGPFEFGAATPIETYEGDYMRSEASRIHIFRGGTVLGQE